MNSSKIKLFFVFDAMILQSNFVEQLIFGVTIKCYSCSVSEHWSLEKGTLSVKTEKPLTYCMLKLSRHTLQTLLVISQ